MATRHVIVGAGPAGLAAVETVRALDPDARITLVCDEPPYARMVLPYYLEGRVEEAAVHTGEAEWFAELGVELRLGARARALDPGAHRLTLDDGSSLDYERLLVATGSRVAVPDIEGADGPGVVPMWTLDHARSFLRDAGGETAIVGAGFIAFTILDAIAARSRSVRFVELAGQVLPRMLDARAAGIVEAHLAGRGIGVHTGARLARIEQAGARRRLVLDDGEALECDAVILATGVRANADFLEGSGIEVRDGIVVDERMRTGAPDVFAAGDVAAGPDLQGGPPRVQAIQPTAVDHGRIAGANMAGLEVAYAGSLSMNVLAAQGLEASSFGRWQGEGDALVAANASDGIYRKYVFEGDVLVGGILVGPTLSVTGTNDVGMLKGLVQTGVSLGSWKQYLKENPLDLRRAYVASGAARELLGSTLLAGRAKGGGGFRIPRVPAARGRTPHHATLVAGAPKSGA
jgi:NAD(P)H-nitrite reductase large subunit